MREKRKSPVRVRTRRILIKMDIKGVVAGLISAMTPLYCRQIGLGNVQIDEGKFFGGPLTP